MKNYLDKVLKELPKYLGHFTTCLTKPKQFIKVKLASDEHQKDVEEGVSFLILSFIIAMLLAAVFPDATNPVKLPRSDSALVAWGSDVLLNIFLIMGSAAIAYFAWRLVGAKPVFQRFFAMFAFFCGVAMVLGVFASATTNIAMLDPVVGKAWVQMERAAKDAKAEMTKLLCTADETTGTINPDAKGIDKSAVLAKHKNALAMMDKAKQRSLLKYAFGFKALVILLLGVWVAIIWYVYGKERNVTTTKIIGAGVMTIVAMFAAELVISLIMTGADTMAMYRECK